MSLYQNFTEDKLEEAAIEIFHELDYECKYGPNIAYDGDSPERNEFLAVNQFTVFENEERRPDIVIFINGIPLVVVELKSASDENVGIENAYNQIQTYKRDIPYNKRTSVERCNSRLKEYFNLDNIGSKGIKKAKVHALLNCISLVTGIIALNKSMVLSKAA